MATAPQLTFQDTLGNVLSSISYIQTSPTGDTLPVNQGYNSNANLFRIYNNYALTAGIASALNVTLTTYDGIGAGSKTCMVTPVSQSWVHMQMYGYGENSTASTVPFTYYLGADTPIGGNTPCGTNIYSPERGSDGVIGSDQIRAYSTGNGLGYIEFSTYTSLPYSGVVNASYVFAIVCQYDWST